MVGFLEKFQFFQKTNPTEQLPNFYESFCFVDKIYNYGGQVAICEVSS